MRKQREAAVSKERQGDEIGAESGDSVRDDLAAVWRRFKTRRCPRAKERLILEFLPLVKYVAGRLAIGLPPSVEMDDLIGSGTLGLLSAVERYDPSRDNKFSTYAIARIRGAMLDELRSMDWIPRSVRKKARQVEDAYCRLENRLKRPASDEEVARELSISVGEFFEMLDEVRGTALVSLDDQINPKEGGAATRVHDTVQDDRQIDPGTAIEVEGMRKLLEGALDQIPERERLIIILYYYEELTLKEIGDSLGVSESRVSQIHTKAVLRLRGRLKAEREGLLAAGTDGRAIQTTAGLTEKIRREYAKGVLGLLVLLLAFFAWSGPAASGTAGGMSDGTDRAARASCYGDAAAGDRGEGRVAGRIA
jgi:RNA polymerase sigma factor for flagellar operon FliA